jgi:hypothetical protein
MLQRIGRYEILKRIASGAQGTVYRARDTVLDRVVAVKVINQSVQDDPVYLEALRREARLAAGLDHPFIITFPIFLPLPVAPDPQPLGKPSDTGRPLGRCTPRHRRSQ